MSINWVEVIASIINFTLLLFLLRRFLYGPIIKVMDEREKKILGREEEAAGKARRAAEEAASYEEKLALLEMEREELLTGARGVAAAEQSRLVDDARRDVDDKRRQWYEALGRERDSFDRELRRRVAGQACLIARQCLQDLADAHLEDKALDLFFKKLGSMPEGEFLKLKEAAQAAGTVKVSSAFELNGQRAEDLKERFSELVLRGLIFDYRHEPHLLCGLELETGDYRLAWSVESYLENVEQQILKFLDGADLPGEGASHVP